MLYQFSFSKCSPVCVCVLVIESCLTLLHPMDCSLPDSSVHGILQARILEWVAIPFSRRFSWSRDQTQVSCTAGRFFTVWSTGLSTPNSTARASIQIHLSLRESGYAWSWLDLGSNPWRRKWQPTPVFLPGESQGRGSLVGCRLWGRTELDTTEAI